MSFVFLKTSDMSYLWTLELSEDLEKFTDWKLYTNYICNYDQAYSNRYHI